MRYILCFFYEIYLIYNFFSLKRFDLVQINGSQQFKGAIAAKLAGTPIIWLLEDTGMDSLIKKICHNLIYHFSSGIIVVGKKVYDYYIKGTKLEKITCIQIPAIALSCYRFYKK